MKQTLLFALTTLILFACAEDPKITAISDHVQTYENTKTDLGFDLLEFEKIGEFRGIDSAKIIHEDKWSDSFDADSNLFEYFEVKTKEMYDDALSYDKELDSMIDAEKDLSLQSILFQEKGRMIDTKFERQSDWIKWSYLNKEYKKYMTIGDSVMYDLYRAKYKIRNPFLNAVQEINDTFYFYPNTDRIAFQK